MASQRPPSWMDEVGNTPPRKPSLSGAFSTSRAPMQKGNSDYHKGPLTPFDLTSSPPPPKSSRSLSFPEGPAGGEGSHAHFGSAIWQPPRSANNVTVQRHPSPWNPQHNPSRTTFSHSPSESRPGPDQINLFARQDYPSALKIYYVDEILSWFLVRTNGAEMLTFATVEQYKGVLYAVVNFKGFRAEVYKRSEDVTFSHEFKPNDIVVVEADRGYDIGQVVYTTQNRAEADHYASTYNTRFLNNLLSFSRIYTNQVHTVQPLLANPDPNAQPKNIRRQAQPFEFVQLQKKEHSETKAKRTCQEKVHEHGLGMEILDVEFQSDGQKLTVYYYAPQYVVFNTLVQDLYKVFKVRIWMSSVTPSAASTRA
ncbi:MAG: hypothetical protein M1831_006871 [Alyxoria varia]|nr:MAG: hypothetical protein M1831_006871 [Alyxoria varia]